MNLALAEGVVRLYERVQGTSYALPERVDKSQLLYVPHPYIGYTLRPDFTAFEGSAFTARINSLGYRGEEISQEKPPRTFRVVCLGGSTTYCTGARGDKRTWPAVAQAELNNRLDPNGPYDRVEFINAGVSGYTLMESFINLKMRVLALQPDLVIIYHGINDAHIIRRAGFQRDYTHTRRSWVEPPPAPWLDEWLRGSHVYGALRGGPAAVKGTTIGERLNRPDYLSIPVRRVSDLSEGIDNFAMTLRQAIAITRLHGADLVLTTFTWSREDDQGQPQRGFDRHLAGLMQKLNKAARDVAQLEGALLIDLYREGPRRSPLFTDFVHRNNAGNYESGKLVADALAQSRYLKGALRSGPRSPVQSQR